MRVRYYPFAILLFTNIFTVSCQEKGSLTYVIDDTYSMHDDIRQVKYSTDEITKIVFEEKASQIKNMVLVTFNDPAARVWIDTQNRYSFKSEIDRIRVYGGGDCEEPSMNGVLLGLQNSRPGSFIYVFTDASAKDYWKANEIKNLCQKKQTQITFVLTGYCYRLDEAGFKVYYDIATACSGIAFFVNKQEVNQVLTTIKETISGNKTTLTAVKAPPYKYTDIPFTIDDQTEYAIVTASGSDVSLTIRGPRVDQQRILWVNNAKVIKLNRPTPGQYVATVKGNTETSVYIVGRTDFLFSHGFSELEPKSIKDTTPQPIADAPTHLSITVTDPKHTVNIISAQILDMSERVIRVLPLKRVSNDFYTTPAFVAPSQRFKVAVIGKAVRDGQDIRRIAKIPVTPQEPPKIIPKSKKPVITIPEGKTTQVAYGRTVKLTCKVSAYPEPKITWKNSHGATLMSQSSVVELPYEYISYLTIADPTVRDTFTCLATNNQGSADQKIDVIVKEPFDVSSSIKGQTEIQYGSKGTLKCDITASVPMHIYWTYKDEKTGTIKKLATSNKFEISADGKILNINKMDLDMAGKYSCKASLDRDTSKFVEFSTQVKVGGLAVPQVTGMSTLSTTKGLNVAISCQISGVPQPAISWQFKAKDASQFVSLSESNNVLHISNANEKHTGQYKCSAQNVLGSAEHVTSFIVNFAPEITTEQTIYKALVGDVAIRIPCDTVGEPKPVITWKTAGTNIKPNSRYSIIDGALIIKDPKESDTKSYVCEAKNALGSTQATFKAEVDLQLEDYGTVEETHVLLGTSKRLECGSDDPKQKVRWFKEGVELDINTKYINLDNLDLAKEGNYSCHVSDMNGARTLTYEVIVGFAPTFAFEQEDTQFDWDGSDNDNDMLDCQVVAKPPANIVWTYNGKVLAEKHLSLSVDSKWGHYTCNVSNIHGAVQKSFDVVSSKCLIKRKPANSLTMPLILSQESTWPVLDSSEDYLKIAPGQTVLFSCPAHKGVKNHLEKIPSASEISASCDKQDTFKVDGKAYKVSDLNCAQEIGPIVDKKHMKCLTDSSELMRVGFDVHGFLETYEVCFDTSRNIPLYTRVLMSKSNRGREVTHSWYKYPGIGSSKSDRGYTCADGTSSCCYSKAQLVNARDFSDGPAQRSTYIDPLNAVPYWRPCDTEKKDPWRSLENMIRSQFSIYSQFIVWSGTHTPQEKNGLTIPRYLWKVLRFDDGDTLAVIYVNDPKPSKEDIRCKNICDHDNVPWIHDLGEQTYCCNINEFLKAFGLQGTSIGESMEGALGKIKSKKFY